MALRTTPTLAICLTAGIAAGVALARPADRVVPAATAFTTDAASEQTGESTVAATSINIEGFAFSTAEAVTAGAPLTVTNLDGATHTLTARDGAFDTGRLGNDGVASINAPNEAGTYEFFCAIHPSMVGSLVVNQS